MRIVALLLLFFLLSPSIGDDRNPEWSPPPPSTSANSSNPDAAAENLIAKLATAKERNTQLEGQLTEKDSENKALRKWISDSLEQLQAKYSSNVSEFKAELDAKKREIAELNLEVLNLRNEIAKQKGSMVEQFKYKQKQYMDAVEAAREKEKESRQFKEKWQNAASGLSSTKLELTKARKAVEDKAALVSKAQEKLEGLNTELLRKNQQIEDKASELKRESDEIERLVAESDFRKFLNYSLFGFLCVTVVVGIFVVIVYLRSGLNAEEKKELAISDDHLHKHVIHQFAFYRRASIAFRFMLAGGIFACGVLFIMAGAMLISSQAGINVFKSDDWKNITILSFPIVFLVTALNVVETKKIETVKLLRGLRKKESGVESAEIGQ